MMAGVTKRPAIVVTDGSLASAALVAIARQTHEVVLLNVAPIDDPEAADAVRRQVEAARPRRAVRAEIAVFDGDETGLLRMTACLADVAQVAREHAASAVFMPLQIGTDSPSFGRCAEWQQIAEDLLRHGLDVADLAIHTPLLEHDARQTADLAVHVEAPIHESHRRRHAAAFAAAGR